jgi:hypothetical protein
MTLDTTADLRARALCVEQVVSLLVTGKYEELEWLSRGVRLNAASIRRVILEYGRTLIEPPENGPGPDWVRVRASSPPEWSVDVPLFTVEEGRSDLTLSLTVRQNGSGHYRVEIDDLHVR